jgi:hypothetical protein
MPKDPALKQRRNRSATRAVLDGEYVQRKRAPSLFRRGEGATWHPMTRAWWRDVWRSPMAAEYVQADIHGLYRLAVLIDQFWAEPTKELAGEIRLQQQAFGLSPIDRRRLEWTIGQAEGASSKRQRRQVREADAAEHDPRSVLGNVDGAKPGTAIAA